ncbi:hypothetical protein [Microseira sp. BLCC-F43]|jgi:hypothetical protein|uniref:hypothetical protein n=1 Tax=Microseira sp. BLCC-F43 TaxID=3153602 RepID=UPI0035B6BA0A
MATFNLGALSNTPISRNEQVSSSDRTDIFQFSLGSKRNFNLALTGLPTGVQAAVSVYKDTNNNSILDAGDQIVASTFHDGTTNADSAINRQAFTAGTYFAKVTYGSGDPIDYKLFLSATAPGPGTISPSNLLPKEIEIGDLLGLTGVGSRTFDDLIGNGDTADVYHFRVDYDATFRAALTGLSADADIRLIKDFNSNGIVDPGETIARSMNGYTAPESITASLDAGDYFFQVYQYSGDTTYRLNLSASLI